MCPVPSLLECRETPDDRCVREHCPNLCLIPVGSKDGGVQPKNFVQDLVVWDLNVAQVILYCGAAAAIGVLLVDQIDNIVLGIQAGILADMGSSQQQPCSALTPLQQQVC